MNNFIRLTILLGYSRSSLQYRLFSTSGVLCGTRSKWMAPKLIEFYKRNEYMKRKGISHATKRSEFLEWNYGAELYAFGKRLNEVFDEKLLREALTDGSYISFMRDKHEEMELPAEELELTNNDNLAKAGSALIEDYCGKYLRAVYKYLPEEGIEALLNYLTSDEILEKVGLGIGLKDLVLTKDYPPPREVMARSFCAVVGCLNVSSGVPQSCKFILDFVVTQLTGKDLFDMWQVNNPLEILEGIFSNSGLSELEPRIIGEAGKHTILASYHVALYCDKKFLCSGYGETVAIAVEQAAFDGLRRLFKTTTSQDPLPFRDFAAKLEVGATKNRSLDNWIIKELDNVVTC